MTIFAISFHAENKGSTANPSPESLSPPCYSYVGVKQPGKRP